MKGISSWPTSVRVYSTLGGTSWKTFRLIRLSASNSRKVCVDIPLQSAQERRHTFTGISTGQRTGSQENPHQYMSDRQGQINLTIKIMEFLYQRESFDRKKPCQVLIFHVSNHEESYAFFAPLLIVLLGNSGGGLRRQEIR